MLIVDWILRSRFGDNVFHDQCLLSLGGPLGSAVTYEFDLVQEKRRGKKMTRSNELFFCASSVRDK